MMNASTDKLMLTKLATSADNIIRSYFFLIVLNFIWALYTTQALMFVDGVKYEWWS